MRTKIIIPFIIIAVLLAYLNSLSNGFVWLDHAEIVHKKLLIPDFSSFLNMLFFDDNNYPGYHRPMYNLIHTMDYLAWGENAFGFHLSSLIIHCANVVLLYYIMLNFSGKKLTSVFIALFFGLLPCHTAAVSLIHSKADLLSCLFILLPIFLYSKTYAAKSSSPEWQPMILWCFLFLLALLSKEVAIMLPFFIMSLAYLLYRQKKTTPLSLLIYPSILGFIFLVYRLSATESSVNNESIAFIDRLLTFIPVYVDYIMKTLTSYELTTNDAVRVWSHIPTALYVLYIILFATILTGQYYFSKKNIFIAAGFLWFNLFLVPVSQLIPILHFRADRFLYLPSIGFILAMAFIFHFYYKKLTWDKHRTKIIYILITLLIYFSIRIWHRNKDFVNDQVMFQTLIKSHPECREAQGFVGNAHLLNGDFDKALFHINKALEKQTSHYSFVDKKSNEGNLGMVFMNQNKIHEALAIFTKLKSAGNYDLEVVFNMGICYKKLRKFSQSKANLEEYLAYKPDNLDALFNLGAVGIELGDKEMAEKYFRRYLDINPTSEYKADIEGILKAM